MIKSDMSWQISSVCNLTVVDASSLIMSIVLTVWLNLHAGLTGHNICPLISVRWVCGLQVLSSGQPAPTVGIVFEAQRLNSHPPPRVSYQSECTNPV